MSQIDDNTTGLYEVLDAVNNLPDATTDFSDTITIGHVYNSRPLTYDTSDGTNTDGGYIKAHLHIRKDATSKTFRIFGSVYFGDVNSNPNNETGWSPLPYYVIVNSMNSLGGDTVTAVSDIYGHWWGTTTGLSLIGAGTSIQSYSDGLRFGRDYRSGTSSLDDFGPWQYTTLRDNLVDSVAFFDIEGKYSV